MCCVCVWVCRHWVFWAWHAVANNSLYYDIHIMYFIIRWPTSQNKCTHFFRIYEFINIYILRSLYHYYYYYYCHPWLALRPSLLTVVDAVLYCVRSSHQHHTKSAFNVDQVLRMGRISLLHICMYIWSSYTLYWMTRKWPTTRNFILVYNVFSLYYYIIIFYIYEYKY